MADMLLEILILLAVVADVALTLAVYRRMTRNDAERELDERVVEAALKAEKDLMSEGLDNIMLFSVNGKTGMEPENWREV
jgi:Tfp pilus assembly protein PilX